MVRARSRVAKAAVGTGPASWSVAALAPESVSVSGWALMSLEVRRTGFASSSCERGASLSGVGCMQVVSVVSSGWMLSQGLAGMIPVLLACNPSPLFPHGVGLATLLPMHREKTGKKPCQKREGKESGRCPSGAENADISRPSAVGGGSGGGALA